ncbi:MAG: HAMP domain-containing protein [Nitrospirae bacterium]|nr:HAMP domain-containing protein [Nitrospirota bacterium]
MNLKIWHKMIIGIAIPSFIAILGGVLTYVYIKDVKKRQGFVLIADDLKEQVLEVRRNEKNFVHYKNKEHFDILNTEIGQLEKNLSTISEKTINEIGEENFSRFRKTILEYFNLSNALFENYQNESISTEKVREEGRELEAFAVSGKHAFELSTNFVLHLRILEKNYMLYRDKKSLDALHKGLAELKNLIPFCNECIPYADSLHKLISLYEKSGAALNELQGAGNALEKITGEVADRERQKINSFLNLTPRIVLAVILLLCTLGPFFVYETASYIVAPIKRLVDITKKISEGDLSQRAAIKEHDETYSLAMSFNTMLDHLQLMHQSLEKSIELLRKKQEQLVEAEKLASLGKFAVGVAHEINNPLAIINEKTGLIKDVIGMSDDFPLKNKLLDTLVGISDSVNRCRVITHRLLGFARRTDIPVEIIDINSLLKEVTGFLEKDIFYKSIKLKFNFTDDLPPIESDKIQLQQVFLNIIKNAIDAMEDGVIEITTGMKSRESRDIIMVSIRDTGHGIPEEIQKNIFEPFFTTKQKGKGTGLGLSITYGLVKRLGGNISVKSRVNEGTTFFVEIPVKAEAVKV